MTDTLATATTQQPKVTVTSAFWGRYRNMVTSNALPYQWEALDDKVPVDVPEGTTWGENGAPYSHSLRNLRIAAGEENGEFSGQPFQDTDVSKWLESASYALRLAPEGIDPSELESKVEEAVALFDEAQDEDGYLDTKFEIDLGPEQRFKGLRWSHELYTMGHFIEAAVAHHLATGSERALNVARRAAQCIDDHFGDEEGKIHGADGHPEIELALARLYEATGERQWLQLAAWFIRVRGQDPKFYDKQDAAGGPKFYEGLNMPLSYFVADKPVLELTEAQGHAVRQLYLAIAIAKVGHLLGDEDMLAAAQLLWKNIIRHRMYVTGAVGSTQVGESFTYDNDLPNDLVYGETCASVAMVFFGEAMMDIKPSGVTGDVIERELFNGTLSGMQLDGKRYFYVNPLEADPVASKGTPNKHHILTRRAGWFDCACCPANLTRLVTSVDRYLYTVGSGEYEGTIFAHQFIANRAEFAEGFVVEQTQVGEGYPWTGDIAFHVDNPNQLERKLAIRIPGWAKDWTLNVNGEQLVPDVVDGFVTIDASSENTDIELHFDMPVRKVRAALRVRDDIGKVAFARGPVVFCMEECDNVAPLWLDAVPEVAEAEATYEPDLLNGVVQVKVTGERLAATDEDVQLYRSDSQPYDNETAELTLIPYYAWCNRAEGQMQVWVREE